MGRDWNIQAKDMHNANVMKRADGQYVIADIGLFNTKIMQSMKSGIFESKKRVIRVKIIWQKSKNVLYYKGLLWNY